MDRVGRSRVIAQFYFAMGDSGVGRRLSCRTPRIILPRGRKERKKESSC